MSFEQLSALIKRHEGFSGTPYRCSSGKLTIGYGRNLDAMGISRDEADYLFANDMKRAQASCMKIFGESFLKFSGNRQAAFVDMAFNMGESGLGKFKRMIDAAKNGDWPTCSDEAKNSAWFKQVGNRAKEDINFLLNG